MCMEHASKVGALQLSGVGHHKGTEAARIWLLGGVAEKPRPCKHDFTKCLDRPIGCPVEQLAHLC